MNKPLKLSEKLFCLAVNPKNGGIYLGSSSALGMTLTGSVFVELMKKELISIEKGMVRLINPAVQNDVIHEFFLRKIREHRKPRKTRAWISHFNARNRKIQKLFIHELVLQNVLRTEEKRILFIPYEKVYLVNHTLVDNIRKDVENVALNKGNADEELTVLALMASKTNLLSRIFPERAQRKEASRNLKKLPEMEISKAVQEAIQMMQAAVFVAATT